MTETRPSSAFVHETNIIEEQRAFESTLFLSASQQGGCLEHPTVWLDPYNVAPLTALAYVGPQTNAIHVTVQGHTPEGDLAYSSNAEDGFLPIYGLYAGEENTVHLSSSDGTVATIQITTACAPENLHVAQVTGSLPKNELIFLTATAGTTYTAGYDCLGECRWYTTKPLCYCFLPSKKGTILTGSPDLMMPPYGTTALWEMTLYGKVLCEYRLPGGFHHTPFELEDGNLLLMTQNRENCTVADCCVLMERESGTVLRTWDLKNYLPTGQGGSPHCDNFDWFHNNAVWMDKEKDLLILSGKHKNCLVALDLHENRIRWMLGNKSGWDATFADNYFLRMEGEGSWFYEQGSFAVLPNNRLLVLDNGFGRPGDSQYSRAVEYEYNEEERTVRQINSWQASDPSPYLGSCSVQDADWLILFGGQGREEGMLPAQPGVFNLLRTPDIALTSEVQFIQDRTLTGTLCTSGNCYHASRLKISDYAQVHSAEGRILGHWAATAEIDLDLGALDAGFLPEDYHLQITQRDTQLVLEGQFRRAEMVLLRLVGNGVHQFFLPTTRAPLDMIWLGTFMNWTTRPIRMMFELEYLSGCYAVEIIIDDKLYRTGIELTL